MVKVNDYANGKMMKNWQTGYSAFMQPYQHNCDLCMSINIKNLS